MTPPVPAPHAGLPAWDPQEPAAANELVMTEECLLAAACHGFPLSESAGSFEVRLIVSHKLLEPLSCRSGKLLVQVTI